MIRKIRITLFLVYILQDLCGRSCKTLGILNVSLERLERRGEIKSVADSLVCNYLYIDNATLLYVSFRVGSADRSLFTVSDKYGQVSEIVYMMVDGLYSERAHACEYK